MYRNKTPKASPQKRSIMEHSPLLPQDTKSVRSCSGNRAKVFLKGHLGNKYVTPNITRSSDSLCTVTSIVNGGDWRCIVRDLQTIIVLVLLAFSFVPQRSHHSPTLPRLRICYCNSNAWGWHNSHQSGVITITDHHSHRFHHSRRFH